MPYQPVFTFEDIEVIAVHTPHHYAKRYYLYCKKINEEIELDRDEIENDLRFRAIFTWPRPTDKEMEEQYFSSLIRHYIAACKFPHPMEELV